MSFEDVLRHYQRINTLARSLVGVPAFDDVQVLLPDPARPEPAFIRASSWLYCLYFECGRASVVFLLRLGEAYRLLDRDDVEIHREAVRCLRTELHHNLGFADSDHQTRMAAELWRRKACGTAVPEAEEQWSQCYERLVSEAGSFLRCIEDVVRRIESDADGAASTIEDWKRRLDRTIPAAAFDPLVEDAKCRLGRTALNTVAFRNRHVDRWRKQLELLEDGFDFAREGTLVIEKTILDEDECVLPISGSDILGELQLKPGPVVGQLLQEARRYFGSHPCDARELLEHLRVYYGKLGLAS